MKSCLQCGRTSRQEREKCPFCGIRTAAGQTAATLEANRQKQRCWMMFLLILLLGGVVAIAFLFHTSPKELFLLSEYENYKQMKADFTEQYGEAVEFSNKVTEQPSISHITLQAGMKMNPLPSHSQAAMLGERFNKAKMAIKAQRDPQNNAGHYNVALNLENEDILDMDFIHTDTQMGIKVPTLYSKLFYLNLGEYGDFMGKIEPSYAGPEKLEFSTVNWKELELTEKEINYLQERYIPFLIEQLKEENFALEKGIEYSVKGEKLKLKKVTLSLTAEETKSFMTLFIDRLIQDKKLHSMLAARIEKAAKAGAIIEANGEVPSQKRIEADMVNNLKQEKKKLQETTFPEGFSSILLIDKKQRIVERTLKWIVASSAAGQVAWSIQTKDVPFGKEQSLKEWTVKAVPKEHRGEITTVRWTKHIKGKEKGRTEKAHLSLKANGKTINFKMKSTFNRNSGEKQKVNRFFAIAAQGIRNRERFSNISGSVKQVQDINMDKKYLNDKLDVTINYGDEVDRGAFSFLIESKSKLVDKVKTVSFSNDLKNSVDVNRITEAQMAQIQQEVVLNVINFINRLGLLGGAPLIDDPQAEDLYKEDPESEEVFRSETLEHEKGVF
ncbi:DUF6583 family protein [Pseudobacillus wudalianchiensis]|uniref:Uncharacterized protein n=1 Tax=Pseudobacillus wudalianchiensis TaxID=1743143 RepID=A0A1B9B7E4_9BACI|nr:DUF6583 family protein [Bacillus wudalianchiensis]OCA91962.1 hypothetical protein A8F95_18810 [Bacillus wudalianchiensis]